MGHPVDHCELLLPPKIYNSPSDVRGSRECGTGRPEVPQSVAAAAVFVEVCDDGLPVEGGVRVPLVGSTLPLPAPINGQFWRSLTLCSIRSVVMFCNVLLKCRAGTSATVQPHW